MKISKEIINIFKNFNYCDQLDEISKLSRKDLYLLLICCSDLHDSDDDVVKENFSPFASELKDILNYQINDESDVNEINELEKEFGKWIPTNELGLPTPYTRDEIREIKLRNILK